MLCFWLVSSRSKLEVIHWNCQHDGDVIPVRTFSQHWQGVTICALEIKKALEYCGVKVPWKPVVGFSTVIPYDTATDTPSPSRYKDPLAPIVGLAQGDQGGQFHVYSIGYILMLGFLSKVSKGFQVSKLDWDWITVSYLKFWISKLCFWLLQAGDITVISEGES